ncbi:hypothetical protein [Neisseria yangbaofengii]|uniref:hypothetical protein n=1 Tax=Neisseria yangbaofengii TaxID=2709396 RepID=UPI0013EBAA08|nr:hypothetical protein [Neisseria yangbaofengii]
MRELNIQELEFVCGGKGKAAVIEKVKDATTGIYHGIVGYNSITSDATLKGNFAAGYAGAVTYTKSATKAGMAGAAAGTAADATNSKDQDRSGNDYGDQDKSGNNYGG